MLTIRSAQMHIFAEASLGRFEDMLFQQLRRFWPARCRNLGEVAVRDSIREGVRRAATHGITGQHSTGRYVFLMYALGFDFETAERSAWAGAILANPRQTPSEKVEALWQRALEQLRTPLASPHV